MMVLGYGLAVVIGLALGALGGGGSILAIPVLVYVLGFGMKEAVPMSLAIVGLTSVVGVWGHHRAGKVRWAAALGFGPAAMVGAVAGARLGTIVSSRLQMIIFALLMLGAAGAMFSDFGWLRRRADPGIPRSGAAMAGIGFLVGALTGLVGVGGGFLYVPALVLLAGISMSDAVGTSLVLIIAGCIAGLAGYIGLAQLDWQATGAFAGLAILGVGLGTRLTRRLSAHHLRRGFAVFLLVMGIVVLLTPR